jgi:hypothetical protein
VKTNYTTRQFAVFLRRRCAEHDEDWRFSPRAGVEPVTDKYLLFDMQNFEKGPWFFFEVRSGRDSCGVYVGSKRTVFVFPSPFNKDPGFETELRSCLKA